MKKLKGIDVSHHQGDVGFDPAKMEADFIIVKATESDNFKDKTFERMADATLGSNKFLGIYHFGKGKVSAKEEADWFVKNIREYIGRAILVLDWEKDVMTRGTGYAKEFCDRVTALTGVKPIIYMSTSTTTSFDWSDFIKSYPYLWGAEYNKNPMVAGYTDNPEKKNRSLGGFKEIIRQYSSNTYLPGFPNRLDVNEAYISRKQWRDLQKVDESLITVDKKDLPPKISIHEAAMNIVEGKPGWKVNGAARTNKAKSLGLDPQELQNEINKIVAERDKATKVVETPKPTTAPVVKTEEKKSTPQNNTITSYKYHTVEKGDTFYKIAKLNNKTIPELKKLNPNILNINKISVGQQIRVQ